MEINNIIKTLLSKRGIDSEEEIQEFLSPKPRKTYDPLLLPDMEAGADLILHEIRNGSRIMIYGDYDADGITATTLMMSVLGHLMKDRPEDLDYYIPSRFGEGYGLNPEAIRFIHDKGFDLIVTVDCGSVSKDEVRYAEELGMKVLVTDHHTITDTMAECLLINPKKPGSEYPFKELCGCGVAFKLAQKLQQECAEFARLSQNEVYWNLSHRACVIAWLKACVLFVANGCKWEKSIEEFIRWSLNYDLWCKMQFFGDDIAKAINGDDARIGKRGPRNLLELLPDKFTLEDAKSVRRQQGMGTVKTKNMVSQWKKRGYVVQMTDDSFLKSEKYKKKV